MKINNTFKNLSIPLIAAPMFLVSGVDLVVECCKSGVVGSFPSLNGRTHLEFKEMLSTINNCLNDYKKSTGIEPAPYAVNLIVNKSNKRLEEDLKACIEYKVPIIITSLGAVKTVVDAIHSYGGTVFHDVIKKKHALKAIEVGVDGIICVSAGAGGHSGTANPLALLKEIKSIYNGKIILAGSITDGTDIAAAITLGADYAYMGTRLIATHESLAPDTYKQLILQSSLDDIIYTAAVSGVSANFLKSSIPEEMLLNDRSLPEMNFHKEEEAKAWKNIWSAGHGVSNIHNIPKVHDLINDLKNQFF